MVGKRALQESLGGSPKKKKSTRKRRLKESENDSKTEEEIQNVRFRPDEEEDEEDVQAEYREEGGRWIEDIYIPPRNSKTEHPGVGERLVIDKVTCLNFKSYAGFKQMGPFHKSFSAIVGPNGNGKSNIIDALLFVFGYRASKIRCKKVSVLIHRSELLPDVDSCSVAVHFIKIIDDGDREASEYAVVPNSEIVVERQAFMDNSSCYRLNEKKVKFQEVAQFLKESGIDIVHNRFLILQGEVEQISQLPPKSTNGHDPGLLEFLEDVIGSHRYIKTIDQLENRLKELDRLRELKLQSVDLVEQEKKKMVEPYKKAKEFLREKNIKTRCEHTLLQFRAMEARNSAEKLQLSVDEQLKAKETTLIRLKELAELINEKKTEFVNAEKSFRQAEKEFNTNKKALEKAEAQYVSSQEELKVANENRKKKKKRKSKLEDELTQLESLPENHERDLQRLDKRKKELEKMIGEEESNVKGDLDLLSVKTEECLQKKVLAEKECHKLKSDRDSRKEKLDKLTKELELLVQKDETERQKLAELKDDVKKIQDSIKKKEQDKRSSFGKNSVLELERKLNTKSKRAEQLLRQEHEKKAMHSKLRGEYEQLKETLDSGNVTDKVYKAFFAAKEQGQLKGLYGRMKDLATIEDKYNVAATVATGVLEYWVTDNDDTATECINFLKARGLPSQTFMCLSKMSRFINMINKPFNAPSQAKRIFDLLKFSKPELAPAYYKAYFNTLVCENIDIATEVGLKGRERHRVATCQGEIVDPSGSMMGGGARITQGKFNSAMSKMLSNSISRENVGNVKQQLDVATNELEEIMEVRQKADLEVRQLNEEVHNLKSRLNNFESDLAALKSKLPLKKELLKEQSIKVEKCCLQPEKKKKTEENIKIAQKEFNVAEAPYQKADDAVNSLADEVKRLQVNEKNRIRMKLDKFLSNLKSVKDEIQKKTVELNNCEKNQVKLAEKITECANEIAALESKMLQTNQAKQEAESLGKELKSKESDLEKKLNQTETEYNKLKNRSNEYEAEEKKLYKSKLGVENELQKLELQVRSIEAKLSQLTSSLEKLSLVEIPDEETEPLKIYNREELSSMSKSEIESKLNAYTKKLNREEPNLNIIDEFKRKVEQVLERLEELTNVTERRDNFRKAYVEVNGHRLAEFMEGFAIISAKLKEMFRMISMGGDAELDLADSTNPFSGGIDFCVRPARKTWKKISNLSGGEKTLSSLSLVFALHYFKPSPFYVMDEIDAALDFRNVSIIANYIKDRTKFTQFIIISLRSNMFELADSLLGIFKIDNMSYSIHVGVRNLIQTFLSKMVNSNVHPANVGIKLLQQINSDKGDKRMELDVSEIMEVSKNGEAQAVGNGEAQAVGNGEAQAVGNGETPAVENGAEVGEEESELERSGEGDKEIVSSSEMVEDTPSISPPIRVDSDADDTETSMIVSETMGATQPNVSIESVISPIVEPRRSARHAFNSNGPSSSTPLRKRKRPD